MVSHWTTLAARATSGRWLTPLPFAMSLFGRPGDLLTHVLVSHPYEQVIDFYYPTPQAKNLSRRKSAEFYDASKACVTLVNIPFVRMREEMPTNIIEAEQGYTQTVDNLNLARSGPRSVLIDCRDMTIELGGKHINFTPAEYVFYAMFARSAVRDQDPNEIFVAPKAGEAPST